MTSLTEHERQILTFERGRWVHPGAKDTAILELFGLTAHRYYQELNGLLDRAEALAHDPILVQRLRRLRDSRRARRTG